MKSKIMKKVLSGILSVSLMFQMGVPVVYAEESNPKQETINHLKITSSDGSFQTSVDNGGLITITSGGSYTLSMDGAASSTTGILIAAPNGTVDLTLDGITVETANECLKAVDTVKSDSNRLQVIVDLNGKVSSLTYIGSDLEKYFGTSTAMNMEVTDSKSGGSLAINGGLFADGRRAPYGNIQFKKGTITIDPKGNTIGSRNSGDSGYISIDGADVIIPKGVDSQKGKVFLGWNVNINAGSFTWEGAEIGNLSTTRGAMMLSLNGGTATVGKLSTQFHQINGGVLNGDVADSKIKIKGGRINGSVTDYTKIQLPYQEGEKISIENKFWDYNGNLTSQDWNAADSEKTDGKVTLWIGNGYDQKITIGSTSYEYKWDVATSSFRSTAGATVRLISDLSYSASLPQGYTNPPQFSITAKKTELAKSADTIKYQWYENGKEITSANDTTYGMPSGKVAGKYTYYCNITCGDYSMYSGIATVNVVDAVAGVVIDGNSSYYDNLNSAFAAVPEGGKSTITLLKDIDLGASSVPNQNMKGDITLNLNGKTLLGSGNNGVINLGDYDQTYPLTITGAGTIRCGGNGTNADAIRFCLRASYKGKLTIEDNVKIVSDSRSAVYLVGGALQIKGNAKLISSSNYPVIYSQYFGTDIIIDGGTLQNSIGKEIISSINGNVVINKTGVIMRDGSVKASNIYFNAANDGVSTIGNTWHRINTDAIQSDVNSNKMEFNAGDNTTTNGNLLYGKKSETVSLTATAKVGYVISDIAAVTKGSTALNVTKTKGDYTSAQNTCSFNFTMPSDDGVAVSIPVKLENCFKLVGESISKVYDGTAFELPTTKGTHFTWSGTGTASIDGYYTDNTGSTQTTEANSGAATNGGAPKNVGTYYAKVRVLADDVYASTIGYVPVTITKSGTIFDGGIKTYKDNTETNTFNYGDTITVKVTPKATGKKPITNSLKMALSFLAPTLNQMALFVGETQITEPQIVTSGQELTFTYDTKGTNFITPDTPVLITAKYVGNGNMVNYEQGTEVTVNAVAEVTKGSTVSYAGTLQGAFDLIGSGETGTIKIFKDIDLGENGVNQTGGSTVTFDLNGYTVKHSQNSGSAITIYSPDITKLTVKSSVDGGTLLESGTSSKAINNAIGKGEVTVESGLICNTGVNGKAIYNAAKFTLKDGTLDTLKNGFSIVNNDNTATIEVTGGIVRSGGTAILNKCGTVTINGGTILGNVAVDNWKNCTANYTKGIILGDCTGEGTYVGSNPQWSTKGEVVLPINAEIPSGKILTVDKDAVLTIANGATLNNNGTLLLNGTMNGTGTLSGTGEFKTTLFTAEDIQPISDQTYTGSNIKPVIAINAKTIMGKEFTIDTSSYTGPTYQKQSSTETWDNDSILNVGNYRAVYTKISDNSIITKEFSVTQANGSIAIKKDYKVSYPCTGNTIAEPTESQIDKLGDGKVTFEWYNGKNEDGTVKGLTKRDTAPVEVGTYTLKAIVAEGTNYKTAYTTVLVTITEPEYNIAAASKDTTGADISATLKGLGSYVSGTLVKVEAPIATGYNFVGWYQASAEALGYTGDILSKNRVYTFKVNENKNLVAVYKQLETASITVDGGSSYTINGTEYTSKNTGNYSLGSTVTVAVSDGTGFAYWEDEHGMIVSRSASYTFNVTGPMTLTAVYNKKVDNKSTVIFESAYGQVMSRMQLGSSDTVTIPDGPVRCGYTFIKWSMTAEEIQEKIKAGTEIIRVTPVYELIKQSCNITVTGGTGSGSYNLNDLVTATAAAPKAGEKFSHWTDAACNILSYSTTYQFYAAKDATITANYVADAIAVEAKGTADIVDVKKDKANSKISFVAMLTVPEGCSIQMAGIIATSKEAVGNSKDGFNKDTAEYVRGNAWSGNAYRYTWTKKVTADQTWYVRAYLVYKDMNGNLVTVYGDVITAGLNN